MVEPSQEQPCCIRPPVFAATLVLGCSVAAMAAGAPALSEGGAAPAVSAAAADSRAAVPEEFRMWIDARAGTGEPVHWVSEGGIYEISERQEAVSGMIGFDSSRGVLARKARRSGGAPDPQDLCLYRPGDRRDPHRI